MASDGSWVLLLYQEGQATLRIAPRVRPSWVCLRASDSHFRPYVKVSPKPRRSRLIFACKTTSLRTSPRFGALRIEPRTNTELRHLSGVLSSTRQWPFGPVPHCSGKQSQSCTSLLAAPFSGQSTRNSRGGLYFGSMSRYTIVDSPIFTTSCHATPALAELLPAGTSTSRVPSASVTRKRPPE